MSLAGRTFTVMVGVVGGACSGATGSGSPKGDASTLVFSTPDAYDACRQGARSAVGMGDGGTDPQCVASVPTISFAMDVVPILAACSTGEICHAPWRYDTLVGQHSTVCCDQRWLVEPGQPSASHVIQAVTNVGACVGQMPLDEGSLSQPEIATLVAWVCQGALDN